MRKTMNKAELIDYVSATTGITKTESKIAIKIVLRGIVEGLFNKGAVTIPNFGRFEIKSVKAKRSRNPRTGETIMVPAKDVVRFKPAQSLKDKVAQR